jgi:hypothetical protein
MEKAIYCLNFGLKEWGVGRMVFGPVEQWIVGKLEGFGKLEKWNAGTLEEHRIPVRPGSPFI